MLAQLQNHKCFSMEVEPNLSIILKFTKSHTHGGGFRNFFLECSLQKINYIRSNKNEKFNISTLQKKKKKTLSLIISFYEFSYFEILA